MMANRGSIAWLTLVVSVALPCVAGAQQEPSQQSTTPDKRELRVAPSAPVDTPEMGQRSASHSPANVCQELMAFLQKGPAPAANAQANKPAHETKDTDQAQHKSGIPAPVPSGGSSASTSTVSIDAVQTMLNTADLSGCQNAIQTMRRAGVAMPPSLLALGALRTDLLAAAAAAPEANAPAR